MDRLTKVEGVPSSDDVKPGMAHFANTGPFGETCGTCAHRGYYRDGEKYDPENGQWITVSRKHNGCAKFKALAGRHGPIVEEKWSACKYFEAKPKGQ